MRHIDGKCHCGNIRFTVAWPAVDGKIPVRACGCTFCVKHGGVYTSHPEAQLAVTVADESRVNRYRFGTETADFYICASCGVVPVVTSVIEGNTYAVVNVNTFEGVARGELDASPTDFDGETTESRLGRRQRGWIPNVTINLSITHISKELRRCGKLAFKSELQRRGKKCQKKKTYRKSSGR